MERACRLARVLRDAGVRAGDRVVLMMENCPDVHAAFQAVWRLGATIGPIMPQLIAPEIRYIIQNSGARLLLTSSPLVEKAVEATQDIDEFEAILVFGENPVSGGQDIASELEIATPLDDVVDCAQNELALLLYTSGTTGKPKGVMLSHGNVVSASEALAAHVELGPGFRTLMVLPLSHIFGASMMLVASMKGWHSTVLRRFDAATSVRALDAHDIEGLWLVPTMLVAMLEAPERVDCRASSLLYAGSGGAPLADEVRVEFERVFDCRVYEGYGHSEGVGAATVFHRRDPVVPGAVGRALPGIDLRVVDAEGCVLPAGETGEICMRGPNVMTGYWRDEGATRAAIIHDWFHTGDLGHIDQAGFVFISGRKKDLIIKGGENISPREIEEALHRHPAVAQAAIIGLPHHRYGEEVAAVIVLKSGQTATAEELRAHAGRFVTRFKVPRQFMFRDELPRTGSGKILKRKLREEWVGFEEGGEEDL